VPVIYTYLDALEKKLKPKARAAEPAMERH